jgi:hypothetical protein
MACLILIIIYLIYLEDWFISKLLELEIVSPYRRFWVLTD